MIPQLARLWIVGARRAALKKKRFKLLLLTQGTRCPEIKSADGVLVAPLRHIQLVLKSWGLEDHDGPRSAADVIWASWSDISDVAEKGDPSCSVYAHDLKQLLSGRGLSRFIGWKSPKLDRPPTVGVLPSWTTATSLPTKTRLWRSEFEALNSLPQTWFDRSASTDEKMLQVLPTAQALPVSPEAKDGSLWHAVHPTPAAKPEASWFNPIGVRIWKFVFKKPEDDFKQRWFKHD